MQGITIDQVRAADVADLALSLLGLGQGELLAADAGSAEAMVAGAQRVISSMSAVMAVAIEAWGRREGEQLSRDKVEWEALADARGHTSRGSLDRVRLRLLDGVPRDEHDFMPSYLAPVLALSPRSAGRRYEMARTLVGCLPVTLAAMRAGDLEPHRAQAIVDEVPAADLGVCAAVEAVLFPQVVDKASTRVGALARRAVAAADPQAQARRAKEAVLGRFVLAGPSGLPGLMRFEAEVEAGKGRLAWAAIEELAGGYLRKQVAATIGQARADAFVDLVLANAAVSTVVDLALPAGFTTDHDSTDPDSTDHDSTDHDSTDHDSTDHDTRGHRGRGHGAGGSGGDGARGALARLVAGLPAVGVLDQRAGTLTREVIEQIVFDPDTVFRRLVIDPDTGWVVDAGATTYHPGRQLARLVRKRDLHCRFPGCATPARFCDLDHVIPFPVGTTVLANLACLCRRHHRLKTHGHWSLTMSPAGVCTWADRRTGVVHTTEPVDYRELAV